MSILFGTILPQLKAKTKNVCEQNIILLVLTKELAFAIQWWMEW